MKKTTNKNANANANANDNARTVTAKALASDMGLNAKTLRAFVRSIERYDDDRYTRYEWTTGEANAIREAYGAYRASHTSRVRIDDATKRDRKRERAARRRAIARTAAQVNE
ncbi:MAG: hypothetical protein KGL39_16530 [Patescibacteria group bacterium]|nr:hypothetical protein [Patescibacteria group bacterium]